MRSIEEIAICHAKEPKFWLVWSENSCMTTVKHLNRDSAVKECARLAGKYSGKKFYILAATAFVVNVPPQPKPPGLQYHWMTRAQL